MEKPFKVAYIIRQKHGVLFQAIKDRNWTNVEAAKYLGISVSQLGAMINLKAKPPAFTREGAKGLRKRDLFYAKLALLTGKSVEELFPEEVYNDKVMAQAKPLEIYVERDLATLKLGQGRAMLAIEEVSSPDHYEDAIAHMKRVLTPYQWRFVEMYYLKGMTYQEIAIRMGGISNARVQHVVSRSLRRLNSHKHILAILRGEEDTELTRALGPERFMSLAEKAPSNQSKEM